MNKGILEEALDDLTRLQRAYKVWEKASEPALLPCPFCGGQPTWHERAKGKAWALSHTCPKTDWTFYLKLGDRLDHIKRWNTRK